MTIDIRRTDIPKTKPAPTDPLPFGVLTTDHMLTMRWTEPDGWSTPAIVAYAPLSLDPAAMALHYGQAVFDGFKAFKTVDGAVSLFRPDAYLARLNRSSLRLDIPQLPVAETLAAVERFVDVEREWVPAAPDCALYLRPTIIATEPHIGVRTAKEYLFFVIASPVGAYYDEGFEAIKIRVEEEYVRAAPGGLGAAKTPANYAASLLAGRRAKEAGFSQVLWLDAVERRWVEEVGSMNIFFKIDGRVVTPALSGSILAGVTRSCVLQLLADGGIDAVERKISIDEVTAAHADGSLEEVFGSGTAAIISPVGALDYRGRAITVGDGKAGPLARRLFAAMTAIQSGRGADPHRWNRIVTETVASHGG
jgi:branched-chain amino acid aminotransferase